MEAPHTWPQLSAGVLRRIMALIYDLLLLLGISFGYGIIVMLLRKLFGADTMQAPQGLVALMILVGLLVTYAGFYCWCWLKRGQTLGMKSWRLRLQKV